MVWLLFRYLNRAMQAKTFIFKYRQQLLMAILAIGAFLFWGIGFPHALSYQEQFQLFLWTGDYLTSSFAVPGGFAKWTGEFLTQFYYVPWLGALLLAMLYAAFAGEVGWMPAMLLFGLLSDSNVILGYVIAVLMASLSFRLNRLEGRKGIIADLVVIPVLYWLAGPMVFLYVLLRITRLGAWGCLHIVYLIAIALLAYHFVLVQQPLETVLTPTLFYRLALETNPLMWIIPLAALGEYLLSRLSFVESRKGAVLYSVYGALCLLVAWQGVRLGFDKDGDELMAQDYLVRNERWDEVIERAERYQVPMAYSSVCVNLALAQKRQLAERMFEFYQNGEDAFIMPYIRENTTLMFPSADALWHLGLVNAAQRYMFDIQEGLLNGQLSGRCTKRIAECMLVNGHYQTADKHIRKLKKSLFYRSWAEEAEAMLGDEERINAHPLYGKIRRLRFRQDQLFSYMELDKMFGSLFMENTNNKMALDYYMGQLLLDSKIGPFRRSMPLVERHGGYRQMPRGYADALNAIASGGRVMGSPYVGYVNRMLQTRVRRVVTSNDDEK